MAITYHGSSCKRCNGTLRYASTRSCVECAKAAVKRRRGNPIEANMLDDLIGNLANYLPKELES